MRTGTLAPLLGLLACEITVSGDDKTPTSDTGSEPTTVTETEDDLDGDGFEAAVDCDDDEPRVYPGAPAACRFEDADCDGIPEPRVWVPTDEPDLAVALADGGLVCLEAGDHAGVAMTGGSATLGAVDGARLVGSGVPALVVDGGAALVVQDLVLTGDVGALVVDEASLSLAWVTVDAPDCTCEGSVLVATDATLDVRDTVLQGVRQTSDGEGPVRLEDSTAVFERLHVDGTEVAVAQGGVFAFRDSEVTMTDTTVVNTAASGAATVQGGVFFTVDTVLTATGLTVLDLSVQSQGLSGGVFYGFGSTFVLEEVSVAGTTADAGAQSMRGLVAEVALDGAFTVVDSTFLAGEATADSCVGLAVESVGPDVALTNVVVQGYRCSTAVSLVDVSQSASTVITYSSFADSDGGFDGAPDPVGSDGNLDVAGTFASPTPPWDLAPAAGSPLLDVGDPARTDPDGSRSDIGSAGGR